MRGTNGTGRLYAMTRLGPGDYICPSNDEKTLWRFQRYVDGKIHGLVVDYEARDFWRALSCPMPEDDDVTYVTYDDLPWFEQAQWLRTRHDAIQVMLQENENA